MGEMIPVDTLLAWGAVYKKFEAAEVIFHEGTVASFYYQLQSGNIRWVNINDNGKEFLQVLMEPGECFGELPLFDDQPYAATAIADTNVVILRLHHLSFKQLIHENAPLHFSFSKLLVERIRFKLLCLKEMGNHNPEQSIIALLKYFSRTGSNIRVQDNRLNLTRQQVADMTGLRVETVIRVIRNLHKKKSVLHIEKGKVYIYDLNHIPS